MVEIFGTEGIINMWTLIVATVLSLGGFIFRKSIANDLLDWKFSVVGAIGLGCIGFIIVDNIFHNIKISIIVAIVGWLAGGFGLGNVLWDGEAGGGSE